MLLDSEHDENENIVEIKQERFIPINNLTNNVLSNNNNINGWDNQSIETVNKWKENLVKLSFIYDVISMKYIKRNNNFLIIIAICSGISTLCGSISSSLLVPNNTEQPTNSYYWVVFGINIVISVLGAVASLLSYIIKLKEWGSKIPILLQTIKNLDNFYVIITSQTLLPYEMREEASSFISKNHAELNRILELCPNIEPDDYKIANEMYENEIGKKSSVKTVFLNV